MPDGTEGAGPSPGQAPDDPGAFLRQLLPPAYVMDLRRRPSGPAQEPVAAFPAGQPSPSVLVLSRAGDPELDEVTKTLRKAGVRHARLNADELASADLLVDPGRRTVRLAGHWLTPTVTWIRHFSARAVDGPATPAYRLFTQDSWQAAADGLAAISPVTIGAGRPGLLTQMRLAVQHGVNVPRTVIGTNLSQAAGELPGGQVVIKALHEHFVEAAPGRLAGIFPVVLDRSSLDGYTAPGPPVIVQEYVEHQAELRVYYVHGHLIGFEVGKQAPADPWLDESRLEVRRVSLDPAVATAARTLASAFRLRLCAFDFLISDGSPVFLELSPDGDWRWIELKTGSSPVSEAAAGMLCDLHRARLPAAGAGSEADPGSFSLLSFLAG